MRQANISRRQARTLVHEKRTQGAAALEINIRREGFEAVIRSHSIGDCASGTVSSERTGIMTSHQGTQRHEHKGPQCKTPAETICKNDSCLHDHHVSRQAEIRCHPVKGRDDLYDCEHGVR